MKRMAVLEGRSVASHTNRLLSAVLIFLGLILSGCDASEDTASPAIPCTDNWFAEVESLYPTGDGAGHGPDIGSLEWRSVVEFKIGIRSDPKVPAVNTQQWCTYIDNVYIRPATKPTRSGD